MSKKRKGTDDEDTKTNPDLQNERETKRAKITLPTPTMLQDLPMEVLERILLEAIVAELRDRKILRSAWKKSADNVIERLRHVCPQWNSVLTASLFRNRLHGIIDTYPEVEISFQLLARRRFCNCVTVTTMNDEVFVLGLQPVHIEIYAHSDLLTKKRSMELPGVTLPWDLVACSVSNCLYVLHQTSHNIAILRISNEGPQFQVSDFITCSTQLVSKMCVSGDGRLILFQGPSPSKITVYNADGTLQRQMELVNTISYVHSIISKSNGNFVLVKKTDLTEFDGEGKAVHEYKTPYRGSLYGAMDLYDRMVTVDDGDSVQLLDSEFNWLDGKFRLPYYQGSKKHFYRVSYNRQRNEFVAFETAAFCDADASQCLTVFNFTERDVPSDTKT